jgi:toxin ParE1/3/4
MVEVDVSVEARADLLELHIQSTIRFGLEVAEQYIEGINAALARLAEFLQSGPVFPGIRPPVRYLAYKRHHIMYDYNGKTVWVIRIEHHARDVRNLM